MDAPTHPVAAVPRRPLAVRVGRRLRRRIVRWHEGQTLLFDDTWKHEVWKDTAETRVALLVQFARPLRRPGRGLADAFLRAIRRSSFVREARADIDLWDANLRRLGAAHGLGDDASRA